MAIFFALGAIARAAYLYGQVEWLRGVPQIMGGLMFLVPAVFLLQLVLQKSSWRQIPLLLYRIGVLLFMLLLAVACIGLGIYTYVIGLK
jgi:hypothetical protein